MLSEEKIRRYRDNVRLVIDNAKLYDNGDVWSLTMTRVMEATLSWVLEESDVMEKGYLAAKSDAARLMADRN